LLKVVLFFVSFSVMVLVAVFGASQDYDNEIAPQKTSKTGTREACIINEAIYVGIIAAGNDAQTRPVIKKAPAGESFGE